ncbi:N-acyl homoserine lactonase family protein [Parvularcula dongshanensis]|uniref:Glyoxylase-like metal-dependent hydrolase (Beta-lactamase superfamily II) n=1 Tax=Parvularcula dongshanensis TaxID=1173995 RepID=A0A840I1P4_9PROT|nr:N-acyl homoserine lactonase family protein [Parvularcula dongshanensis]MBB4658162.1 glyoxylase-like metal-dependent hydrolase (beta-lactamase superfamily II) [Parvularcula dongshanensis]
MIRRSLPVLLLLAACASENEGSMPAEAAAPKEAAPASLTLTALDCGTIEALDLGIFDVGGAYDGQTDTLADSCWLIEHEDGTLLWDLGLPAGLVEGGPMTDGPFRVSLTRTLADQLAERGVTPDFVAISHSHFDHVGQPEAAEGAVWLAQRDEREAMEEAAAADETGSLATLLAFETESFDGERDVFGDGRVKIIEMRGHTPGHSVLWVDLAETGPVLLAGDLYHLDRARELRTVPTFNSSEAETRASMAAFEALAQETGARVIIQHEDADVAPLYGTTLR